MKENGIFNIRTDLAYEEREKYQGRDVEISGVLLEEEEFGERKFIVSKMKIINSQGQKCMNKPIGSYITMHCDNMGMCDAKTKKEIAYKLSELLRELIGDKKTKLIVGLGNRDATPDALGPIVVSQINVGDGVYAVSPGVMAQTGMETVRIIKGLVHEMNPDIVIVIDALAARSIKRVNSTIQLTDTGISPGSGVGNNRKEISRKTIGTDVIAIGVPTVVDAVTIILDTISFTLDDLPEEKKEELAERLAMEKNMYVTPKDVDENVKNIGEVLTEGINTMLGEL